MSVATRMAPQTRKSPHDGNGGVATSIPIVPAEKKPGKAKAPKQIAVGIPRINLCNITVAVIGESPLFFNATMKQK